MPKRVPRNRNATDTPRKRARVEPTDLDLEEDEIRAVSPQPSVPQHTQSELLDSDAEDDDEEENFEDDDEQAADQVRLSCENGFAHSGILHSVRLDRFMSHDCFEYNLGQNVNIVNGANGSGKSAIVAALQIAFGARATSTERASKIEEHIKHGERDAIITVKILNRKPPATNDDVLSEPDLTFRHQVYGDYIIVERRLFRGKSSSVTMKAGRNNRAIPIEKPHTHNKELGLVVDHFGFMVENPVAILTQTKSKAFLAKGKPSQHYKLYREATLLAPLDNELSHTKEVTRVVEAKLANFERSAPTSQKKLEALEASYRESQEMSNIDARIRNAETRFAWTVVQEHEQLAESLKVRISEEYEPDAERARVALDKVTRQLADMRKSMDEHNVQLTTATEQLGVASQAFREIERNKKTAEYECDRQKRKINEFESLIADYRERIHSTETRREKARKQHFAGQVQKTRILQEIRDIEDSVTQKKSAVQTCRDELTSLQEALYSLEEERRTITGDSQRLSQEYEDKRRNHMRAMNSLRNNDSLSRFGVGIPQLIENIRRHENRFHRRPIGPLAQYVKLKDETWAPAIEQALGRATMNMFIVHDVHDAGLIERYLPRNGHKPVILVASLDREQYNIGMDCIPDVRAQGHRTILDTVDVLHDAVFNALVDQSQIEKVVLFEGNGDITSLGWSRIPNLSVVWNKKCDRAYTRNGSNTFRPAHGHITSQYLTTDMRPYVDGLQREVEALEIDMRNAKRRGDELYRKFEEMKRTENSLRQQLRDEERKIADMTRRKEDLDDQLSRAENAFDSTSFDLEIQSHEQNIEEQSIQKATATSELSKIEASMGDLDARANEARLSVSKAKTTTTAAHKALKEIQNDVGKVTSRERQLKKESERSSNIVKQAHQALDAKILDVTKFMETARAFGDVPDDINPEETPSEMLKREITTLKRRLETEQERRGGLTAREIEVSYLRAKKKDQENQMVYNRIIYYKKALRRGIENRQEMLKRLNQSLKKMVRSNFRQFLGTRGHSGNITFTSEGGVKQLCITTKMASHRKGDGELYETKDLRSLSGGERSYTTLAFMLALAEVCQNPVRVMDEIDVFQDEANRRASFKTIIDFCTQYLSNRQFIIITPLSLPNVESSPAVRIVKLEAPRKGSSRGRQTRIDQYSVSQH